MLDNSPNKTESYSKNYDKKLFWNKVKKFASSAGKSVLEPALTLYYCARDPDTPAWAKAVIFSALGYFISPLDAIPDLVPGVGYTDDLGALASAFAMVLIHIKAEHKAQAREQLKTWFA